MTISDEVVVTITDESYSLDVNKRLYDLFERISSDLDGNERIGAEAAIRDAVSLCRQIPLQYDAWVSITDDGTAVMQWREGDFGIAFIVWWRRDSYHF